MSKFQVGHTWSHTLGNDIDVCLRRVYYRVYGGWGGWSQNCDSKTRLIYTVKQSRNLAMYGGTVIHTAIQAILQWYRMGRKIAERGKLIDRVNEKMIEEIEYSRQKQWEGLRNPKKATLILIEHLSGEDLHLTRVKEAIEHYQTCMANFLDIFLVELQELGPNCMEVIDSLDSMPHRGWTLFAVPDLVHNTSDKKIITDWKTGSKPDIDQLGIYGLYLTQRIDFQKRADVSDISARSIPLLSPETMGKIDMTEEILAQSMSRIDRHIDILNPLDEAGKKKNPEPFSKTIHKGECEGCLYKFICDQEIA